MTDEKKPKGFAAMTAAQRSEIASKGGKAAQSNGRAHRFDSKSGQAAARKRLGLPPVTMETALLEGMPMDGKKV